MQSREKILASLLVIVLLSWWGVPLFNQIFLEPVTNLENDLDRLNDEIGLQELDLNSIRRARNNLRKWSSRSLPPDSSKAQRLFLEWLTDLANMSGFKKLTVKPSGTARAGKIFTPIRVSIEAEATYEQLGRFLDRFRKADLLNRIADMTIKSASNSGNPVLTINLTAEGLALADVSERDYLLPQSEFKEELSNSAEAATVVDAAGFPKEREFLARSGSELLRVKSSEGNKWTIERAAESTTAAKHAAGDTVELFHILSKKKQAPSVDIAKMLSDNLFVKGSSKPKVKQDPLESDYAKKSFLRALIAVGDEWEGWLSDPANKTTILHKGSEFKIMDLDATVIDIQRDHLVLQTGKEKRRLNLGDNLNSMKKIAEAAPSEDNTPSSATNQKSETVKSKSPSKEEPATPKSPAKAAAPAS